MIQASQLNRVFEGPSGIIAGLSDVSLQVRSGEFVVLQGPSGSGKSTLLLTLGGMLRPTSGIVRVGGVDLYALSQGQRARFRAQQMGFVFQLFHLVPYLTVRQNLWVGLDPDPAPEPRERVEGLLEQLGLVSRADAYPGTLSAGERQRVALGRAMVRRPPLLLADEPTGNLDPDNAAKVFQHLDYYRRDGGTVVVVTHGSDAHPYASRVLKMSAGILMG